MKKYYLRLICGVFFLSGFVLSPIWAEEVQKTEEVRAGQKFSNKEKNYAIEYPKDWQKQDIVHLDLVLFIYKDQDKTAPHATMNVVAQKIDTDVPLDNFYSENLATIKSNLKDVDVKESGDTKLNGIPSKWIYYTHVMDGTKLAVLQYFIVNKNSIYLLTFSSAAGEFDLFRPEFKKVAESFDFLKKN